MNPFVVIGRRPRLLAAAALALVALVAASVRPTVAAFTDDELATGPLAAGSVAPVTAFDCTGGLFVTTASVTWGAPASGLTPTAYRVTAGSYDVTTTTRSASITNAAAGSGSSFTISVYALVGSAWTSTAVTGTVTFYSVLGTAC